MGDTDPQAGRISETILADLPEPAASVDGTLQTAAVLAALARSDPAALDTTARRDLEALCRKVHVARRVDTCYSAGWKKRKGEKPLELAWWPVLVAVLLAHSNAAVVADEEGRGYALKQLNAALAAIDLASARGDVPHLDALRAWADALLAAIPEATG